jgi:NAD(P)-dependent dehydrogenase (short-subunit alcohol dehydrogenase family)
MMMTKRALVYGGTGGIGLATARLLKSRGFQLHLVARDGARLAASAAELGATFTAGDIADPAIFAKIAADFGDEPLDALVYAIGSINLKPLARLTEADFTREFTINALGAALAVQAALPVLKRSEAASIVLFSSVAVGQGFAAHASVSMAKGAVEGLTRALGAELAPKIRVNCIAPSLTKTPLAAMLTGNEAIAKAIGEMHALQRLGEASDIAALAAFLASEDAGWMSGQVIAVDGGRSRLRTKG